MEPHALQIMLAVPGSIILARYWWRKLGARRRRLQKSEYNGTDLSAFLDPVFMTKVLAGEVAFGNSLSFPVATMLADPRTAKVFADASEAAALTVVSPTPKNISNYRIIATAFVDELVKLNQADCQRRAIERAEEATVEQIKASETGRYP